MLEVHFNIISSSSALLHRQEKTEEELLRVAAAASLKSTEANWMSAYLAQLNDLSYRRLLKAQADGLLVFRAVLVCGEGPGEGSQERSGGGEGSGVLDRGGFGSAG